MALVALPPAVIEACIAPEAAAAPEVHDGEVADVEDVEVVQQDEEAERSFRHPAGTWKIWEGTWFYMTKTPGWIDMKCWVKAHFRTDGEGLGRTSTSKTLTPYHYGNDWDNPWRTMLLLRSWTVWRARWLGWARAKPCRQREVERQVERLMADVRQAHDLHEVALCNPLFASAPAHRLMARWVPDIVSQLVA